VLDIHRVKTGNDTQLIDASRQSLAYHAGAMSSARLTVSTSTTRSPVATQREVQLVPAGDNIFGGNPNLRTWGSGCEDNRCLSRDPIRAMAMPACVELRIVARSNAVATYDVGSGHRREAGRPPAVPCAVRIRVLPITTVSRVPVQRRPTSLSACDSFELVCDEFLNSSSHGISKGHAIERNPRTHEIDFICSKLYCVHDYITAQGMIIGSGSKKYRRNICYHRAFGNWTVGYIKLRNSSNCAPAPNKTWLIARDRCGHRTRSTGGEFYNLIPRWAFRNP